jgi:hypothetical protein
MFLVSFLVLKRWRSCSVFFLLLYVLFTAGSLALANSELPIATTIPLSGVPGTPGMVVRYNDGLATYTISQAAFDTAVYGVVGERPAIVFMTASNTTPIVTQGVSGVLVDASQNGPIVRGDVLTTSPVPGVAMRANLDTTAVFAVALEDHASGRGVVQAEVGVEGAMAVQQVHQAAAADETATKEKTSLPRILVAVALTLGALGFLLYSFRSILSSSVLSIGRNPRARKSVVWIAAGSLVMVLLLVIVVIFVAIGVLVLPI